MILKSKFEIGQEVFFLNETTHKVEKGTVYNFRVSVEHDHSVIWTYMMELPKKEGHVFAEIKSVDGQFLFADRDEIFKFVYGLTENI